MSAKRAVAERNFQKNLISASKGEEENKEEEEKKKDQDNKKDKEKEPDQQASKEKQEKREARDMRRDTGPPSAGAFVCSWAQLAQLAWHGLEQLHLLMFATSSLLRCIGALEINSRSSLLGSALVLNMTAWARSAPHGRSKCPLERAQICNGVRN